MKWKNRASDTTTYFITATITQWRPVLLNPCARCIILEDLNIYRMKYACKINAYVIMPEHYHLVIDLNQPEDLHNWLHDFQLHTSNELAKWLRKTADPEELEIYRQHANGKAQLAVWKEQARALGITTEKVLRTKIDYIHNNPVKRKLVNEPGEWIYSSWRNYCLDDDSVFRIDRVEML